MIKIEMIGNLGADAEIKQNDRGRFVTFTLYHSETYYDKSTGEAIKQTTRASVTYNGELGELMKYMKTGFRLFVRGDLSVRTYTGNDHLTHAGINIRAREIEPIFDRLDRPEPTQEQAQAVAMLQQSGLVK